MRELPSVPWGQWNVFYPPILIFTFIPSSFTEREMSVLPITLAEQRESLQKRIATSLTVLLHSPILPMASIQEGLFSKSMSFFGLWRALVKSRRTNRSLFPGALFFTWRDNSLIWGHLRCCTLLKQAMTIIEHCVVVLLFFLAEPSSHEKLINAKQELEQFVQ